MRTLSVLLLAFVCTCSQAQLNIDLLGQLNYQSLRNSDLANLWGYTDELGNEYALVGVNGTGTANPGGISVVSLVDPANPVEVFFFPGPASIWREVKVWDDHAYITTEANSGGITIVDLSPLPQSTALNAVLWNAPDWETAHSLFIDENGRLYIHGTNRGNGGVIMYDLTQDPMNPVEVGAFDQWYCHDSFARGDTLYAGHIYNGFFSIVDVSVPTAPILLGTRSTPNLFTHNTWLDDSGNYLFTTDERTNSYVAAYDVSDPTDIVEVDRLRSDNGSGAIPHNTYWKNDYVITSYYTYGVSIYDATYPHNMVEVGNYDTSPFSGDGFHGAWGVYPFFDSDKLIISDIEGGLFVLDATYMHACWLEGLVTNAQSSAPVNNATVTVLSAQVFDITGLDGAYATGYHAAGTYSVQVSAPGYIGQVIDNVVLENGVLTVLNIQLEPAVAFTFQALVVTEGTTDPVPNAKVNFVSTLYNVSATADANGSVSINNFYGDTYDVNAGAWGWRTSCLTGETITPASGPYTIELVRGYSDDFALDLGWQVTNTATDGMWERGTPVGTTLGGAQSNPGADVGGDCGTKAYVTGNGGGSPGDDDVDGGYTRLTSPVFDATGMIDPHVRYARWFYNGGGSGSPNDDLIITLSNGSVTVTVETVTIATAGMSTWASSNIRIVDHLTPTANMRLIVTAEDHSPGHVMEAGLDIFELIEEGINGTEELNDISFQLWPNPNNGGFHLQFPSIVSASVEILDAIGRNVKQQAIVSSDRASISVDTAPGVYTVRVRMHDGRTLQKRMLMVR